MAEESVQLDNTEVAAEEGEALVEEKGKLDEGANAKAQQKAVEEVSDEEEKVESKRTTRAETAKEGKDLLDGEELGKTRSQTKNGEDVKLLEENGKDKEDEEVEPDSSEPESNGNHAEDEPSVLKRTRSTEEPIKEGDEVVKKPKVDVQSEEVLA